MFLTPEELIELTGRRRSGAQIRALRYMGIAHKVRPDGVVRVLRSHVEHLLGAVAGATVKSEPEPNWGAM